MFYGAAPQVALAQHSSALGVDDIFCHGVYDGHSGHVNALYLITVVLRCGVEGHGEAESGMQSLSTKRKTAVECILLQHVFY